MEKAVDAQMISPIRELRWLYRDAEAKAARLRLVVHVRSILDRAPWEAAVAEVLSAILTFSGAKNATIRSATGEVWQCDEQGVSSQPITELFEVKFRGTVRMAKEWIELGLSKPAVPINDEDRETIQIVVDQLAAHLTAERQRAVRERLALDLQTRERELARLVELMIGVQEQERRRIAYDLHDSVAQSLVSLLFQLEAASVALHDNESSKEAIESAIQIARTSIGDVRDAIAALRPAELDDLGLEAALRGRLDSLTNIEVRFQSDLGCQRFAAPLEVTFYRIAQEALANAVKHSACSRINVRLLVDDPDLISLRITDNGCGITALPPTNDKEGCGIGLSSMRERMALIGGILEIRSTPGDGTTVLAQAPITNLMKDPI